MTVGAAGFQSPAAWEGAGALRARLRDQLDRATPALEGLSAEQRQGLEALTHRRADTSQSWLTWLRQMPEAAKPTAMLGLIERLAHVRKIGIDATHGPHQ